MPLAICIRLFYHGCSKIRPKKGCSVPGLSGRVLLVAPRYMAAKEIHGNGAIKNYVSATRKETWNNKEMRVPGEDFKDESLSSFKDFKYGPLLSFEQLEESRHFLCLSNKIRGKICRFTQNKL